MSTVEIWHDVAVFTLWLKKVKESLADIWEMTGVRLLPDDGSLQQELIHIIWTNAESPVSQINFTIQLKTWKTGLIDNFLLCFYTVEMSQMVYKLSNL